MTSHISMKVIELCGENNIEFVCLPPNATDKLQPWDVGLFAPMKSYSRKQLQKYKEEDFNTKLLHKTVSRQGCSHSYMVI